MLQGKIARQCGSGKSASYAQLFEITVIDVLAAPVRDSIELDAVGELHVGLVEQELELPEAAAASCFAVELLRGRGLRGAVRGCRRRGACEFLKLKSSVAVGAEELQHVLARAAEQQGADVGGVEGEQVLAQLLDPSTVAQPAPRRVVGVRSASRRFAGFSWQSGTQHVPPRPKISTLPRFS